MPSETDANRTQASVAFGHCRDMAQQRTRIVVVGGKFFCVLIVITLVGSRLVIGEHSPRLLQFVIHLGHSNQIAMSGKERGESANRSGHLKDLGIKEDARAQRVFNARTEKIGPHRTIGGGNVLNEIIFEDHVRPLRESRYAVKPIENKSDNALQVGHCEEITVHSAVTLVELTSWQPFGQNRIPGHRGILGGLTGWQINFNTANSEHKRERTRIICSINPIEEDKRARSSLPGKQK